jgi:two-component system NarL family response regulator
MLELLPSLAPDVVLLDVHMPDMSGLDALERALRREPGLKVIMLSMHDQAGYVRRAVTLGALGYLLKSTGLDELVRAIRLVADGQAYLQGELAGVLMTSDEERPHLSSRELDVLRLLTEGLENKQIAHALGISEATVKTHLKSLYRRLGVRSRAEAAAKALRLGLIE